MKNLTFRQVKKDNSGHPLHFKPLFYYIFFAFIAVSSFACQSEKAKTSTKKAAVDSTGKTSNPLPETDPNKKTIVFFGNSLTAGYGLEYKQGFTGWIEKRIDSLGLAYNVVNAGLSGETTSGGKERIDWLLENTPMDIFVLELGANDALRGLPVKEAKANLQSILTKVKAKYPNAQLVLVGMLAPPNMGKDYASEFAKMYPSLSTENKTALVPFLLDGVAGNPELNLPDGIHPNLEGHKIVTENVWKVLKTIL